MKITLREEPLSEFKVYRINESFTCCTGNRKGKKVKNAAACFKRKNFKLSRKLKIARKHKVGVPTNHTFMTKKR